jgi:trigger factor
MQKPTITHLPQSRVEFKFTVTPDEAKPYLDQAVTDISNAKPLKGFRPGKAGYEDVKREYGEMAIWEAAIERIIRAQYVKAVLNEKIEVVGSPQIAVEKLVPNQDVSFKAIATVMPRVTNLVDYSAPLVERKKKVVGEKEVTHAIEDLQKMRRVEVVVDRAATKEDMVLIDLEIKKDHVTVEGGVSRDYRVYLNEEQYIPGFADKLVGVKKGDVKSFEMEFPKDHYNKQLAGQMVEFAVTVKDVFELQLPTLDDVFAKTLGAESLDKLKELLQKNLQQEEDQRSLEASEIELLAKLSKGSRFSEIPELLVNEEVRRMLKELESTAEQQGMDMKDYLASIKKTKDDLTLDFIPRALERIQTALLIKEVGKREKIDVTEEEVDAEQDRILDSLKETDTETRNLVASPDYREYMAVQMKNRRVVELLRKKGIKE